MIIGIVFGILISVINTRFLGTEDFGNYKFIQSVYSFFIVIIAFGYVVTAGKLVAEKRNDNIRRELIGASIIITTLLGLIFIFAMIIFSFFQKSFFPTDLSYYFIFLSPLFFFMPFTQTFENILQGENKIYELAIYRLLPQLLYIAGIFILYKLNYISLKTAVTLQLSTYGIASIIMICFLRPRFSNLTQAYNLIILENKKYGFQVYIGSIVGVASTQFGPIAISFFSNDNIGVGFFSLAMTITMPLVLIPTVIGTSMFKEFANMDYIPKKATNITILLSIASLVAFIIIIKPVILFLYSVEFIGTVKLAYIVAVGQMFHGFGNYYNRFLGSKGQGRYLRNGAISVGIANILGFVFLVPFMGATGAAVTKLFSGIIFTISMLYYYKKFRMMIEST